MSINKLQKLLLVLIMSLLPLLAVANQPSNEVHAQSQPGAFEALLYNDTRGEIIAVNNVGTELERTALPSLGSQTFSEHVEVSPDGNRVAYVLTDMNANTKDLMIYDRNQDTIVGQYQIPAQPNDQVYTSLDFAARSEAFGPAQNQFAFGYSINFQEWHVVIFDIALGRVNATVDHTTHPSLTGQTNFDVDLPIPRRFDGQFVDMTMIATGTEGAPEYPAYRWDIQMNTVQSNTVFRDLNSDYLDDDFVLTVPDYNLQNSSDQIQSPFPQINAVYAADSDTGSPFPVFNAPNLTLYEARFIENGRRVAVASGDIGAGGQPGWKVIDRTGNLVSNLGIGTLNPHEVLGLPSGLIYSAPASDINAATGYHPSPNAGTTALMYISTLQPFANDPGTRLWLGDVNQFPELVWVSERQSAAVALPSSWDPLQSEAPATVADPCINDPNLCNLSVGIQAEINTTQGDDLNVRSAPGLNFDVLTQISNGSTVTLLEGPSQDEGLNWWRIETASGQMGWIVEYINGVQVILAQNPTNASASNALMVGDSAVVTTEGDNLNAHTQPNVNSTILVVLQAGDVVQILDGPRRTANYVWWEVQTSAGPAWVAQGDGTDMWIQTT